MTTLTMATSASLLPAPLQSALSEILSQSNARMANIQAILLSTTEGVPLGRVVVTADTSCNDTRDMITQSSLNEDVLSNIESVWSPVSKQIPVLGLEKIKQVTAVYDHGTLIHFYQAPMVVTILCGGGSSSREEESETSTQQQNRHPPNLGAIRSTTIPLLKKVLEPLAHELVASLQPDENDPSYP